MWILVVFALIGLAIVFPWLLLVYLLMFALSLS